MLIRALIMGVVLAGPASTALAQERHVGIKLGVNVASAVFEGESALNYDEPKIGLLGGGFAVLPVTGPLAVQIEALFSQKGAKLSVNEPDTEFALELDYLDFPVLARLAGPASGTTRLHVFVGPSLGYRMGARSRATFTGFDFATGEVQNIERDVSRFDLGLVAGAGVDIGRRLVVDGRYSWGLTNLNTDESAGAEIRNRVLSLMAGVRF